MGSPPAGDAIPQGHRIIEIRVAELRQLFNAIDPSPFRERDLDPRVEQFIVEWSADFPTHAPLALVVHLERTAVAADELRILREAVSGVLRSTSHRYAAEPSRSVSTRPHQPCDCPSLLDDLDRHRRCDRGILSREPVGGGDPGRVSHWWLGGNVATDRGVPVRLVADPG